MPSGIICDHGRGQMNIIKSPGSEPTMTVAWVGNKRRVATDDEDDQLCSDFNPNEKRPYGLLITPTLCP